MSSEITPGPWRVGDAGRTVYEPPNGTGIPEVVAWCRSKANAQAIAALPDLIAAMKMAIDYISYVVNDGIEEGGCYDKAETLKPYTDALKKAGCL